jgi:hypothetical protein
LWILRKKGREAFELRGLLKLKKPRHFWLPTAFLLLYVNLAHPGQTSTVKPIKAKIKVKVNHESMHHFLTNSGWKN